MRILIIGPFPKPITGNSLANQVVFENLPKCQSNISVDKINTSYSSLEENLGRLSLVKVMYYLKQYVGIIKIFNCDNVNDNFSSNELSVIITKRYLCKNFDQYFFLPSLSCIMFANIIKL